MKTLVVLTQENDDKFAPLTTIVNMEKTENNSLVNSIITNIRLKGKDSYVFSMDGYRWYKMDFVEADETKEQKTTGLNGFIGLLEEIINHRDEA